jgi:hypothetical protein
MKIKIRLKTMVIMLCLAFFTTTAIVYAQPFSVKDSTVTGLPNIGRGCTAWGDYNNDGFLDLLMTGPIKYPSPGDTISRIYKNNGDGTFTDAGIVLPGVAHGMVAWCDYNNDGYLDFFIAGISKQKVTATKFLPIAKLYKNSGPPNYTFTEVTTAVFQGISGGAAAWGDYNNDGLPDIAINGGRDSTSAFTSNELSYMAIFKNNGDGTFSNIGLSDTLKARLGTVVWGDFNNDGYLDLWDGGLTSISPTKGANYFLKNNGNGTFTNLGAGTSGFNNNQSNNTLAI